MRKIAKHISCLTLLLAPFVLAGQELPSLGVAPEIQRGSLPDGIRFYLVTNPAQKGFADFALVQRGQHGLQAAQEALRDLPHFGAREPYRFLADHGVGYDADGYLSQEGDATVFTFRNVPTFRENVADSTLLLLFDISAACRQPQAVLVCGDIDAARIRERMGLLSMMVPALDERFAREPYLWNPRDTLSLLVTRNTTEHVAAIHAIFCSQRLPEAVMDTPQPLISKVYADQLGQIVRQRIERGFRSAGIPLADFRYRYRDSAQGSGDELHSFSVYTDARRLDAATRQFAAALSSLDKEGSGVAEFEDTKDRLIATARRYEHGRPLSNREYLDKCIASFLYGANLASEATLNGFVAGRRLDDERERELFDGFARALLDSARNLTLRYDIPDGRWDEAGIRRSFNTAWATPASAEAYKASFGDTLSLYEPAAKVRLRADAAEPLSGGRLWTFSNGIKVIYKQADSPGEFHYALLLRGGVAEVPGLQAGESAFVGDMLSISRVAGLSGADFHDMLRANGISMQESATLLDLRITGLAPRSKLPLLLRALLSIAHNRQPDPAAFDYYKASEALRIDMEALSPRDVNSLMDSIMRPNYFYTDRKQADRLRDDLPQRAEQYFASVFAKANDGILVLIGDLNEDVLKKELSRTLGDFQTSKTFSQRPRVDSRFATGSVTRTDESAPGAVGGGELGVNVALSAAVPFNLENFLAFQLATEILRKQLTAALADRGAYAELSGKLELFPSERLSLYINCHPCLAEGLPAGVTPADPLELLDAVRSVTLRLEELPVEDADLKAYKELLLNRVERRMKNPAALLDDVLIRYSEGKDLITEGKTALQQVSADQVRRILSLLEDGASVEYVII